MKDIKQNEKIDRVIVQVMSLKKEEQRKRNKIKKNKMKRQGEMRDE
jgi:hypothetical protein